MRARNWPTWSRRAVAAARWGEANSFAARSICIAISRNFIVGGNSAERSHGADAVIFQEYSSTITDSGLIQASVAWEPGGSAQWPHFSSFAPKLIRKHQPALRGTCKVSVRPGRQR